MISDLILPGTHAYGQARLSLVTNGIWVPRGGMTKNQICYDWASSVAALLRGLEDGDQYKVCGMYLEFDNSGVAVDPTPTISRDTTVDYYRALTGTQDFLRVPLIATSGSNSDDTVFTTDNVATFYTQSSGTLGQRTTAPLTFSDAANSNVYGAALVAFRDEADITRDLVISRVYFAAANQVEKVASSQIGVTWSLTFG
jgi:hypothetical protein